MRMYAYSVTVMLCLLLVIGAHGAMGGTDDVAPNTEDRVSPGGVIVGGVTELGMLALGIVWEGVRIVLPEGCPLKEREIDDLVGTHHCPYDSIDRR
ncbi:MAG: hypothetical protein JW885_15925 [Deltaproteobacteria bacterium]|nr:hypothetical protein [Candidatus Zymogenaceae bacterium]